MVGNNINISNSYEYGFGDPPEIPASARLWEGKDASPGTESEPHAAPGKNGRHPKSGFHIVLSSKMIIVHDFTVHKIWSLYTLVLSSKMVISQQMWVSASKHSDVNLKKFEFLHVGWMLNTSLRNHVKYCKVISISIPSGNQTWQLENH